MYRLPVSFPVVTEGLNWLTCKAPISETEILDEEANFRAEIRKLFYPDSNFVAAGMNRKNSEEDEVESCDSSEDDVEEFADVDASGEFFH